MNSTSEYLKREDCNFISVDWERVAMAPYYIRAAIYSEVVGELTGQLINYLVDQGADLRQFHVIGFSLGAHVAGKAGAVVNGLLPRITGTNLEYFIFKFSLVWYCSLPTLLLSLHKFKIT